MLSLSRNLAPNAPAEIANSLWYKYRSSRDWSYVVWDYVITGLQQSTSIGLGPTERIAIAHRYAQFLLHVDLHSADGIDCHVTRWFSEPGITISKSLCCESWLITNIVILYLTVHGALRMSTPLQGVVFPAWELAAAISSAQEYEENRVFLEAMMTLCRLLFTAHTATSNDSYPMLDLMERQRLRTRRKGVFQNAVFEQLVARIPSLVAIEVNEHLGKTFREAVRALRYDMCCDKAFRLGACRNIGMVVDSFAKFYIPPHLQEQAHESLVAALRLIFNEEDEDQGGRAVLLSPWRLSTTAAVTSFVLQQTGRYLETTSCSGNIQMELSDLPGRLVNNSVTAQEADFVSEMVKGVNVKVAAVVSFVHKLG